MSIAAFIGDTVLRPRLREAGCMVVYDPDRRYHGVCTLLEDGRTRVIDASESSIEKPPGRGHGAAGRWASERAIWRRC